MERTMNKLVLSTLAVMTAVSICGVQPVDAKSVKPDPTMTMLHMPKNDEISVGNGTTKEINKQTQLLVNNVAVSTRSMIKKNWKRRYHLTIQFISTIRIRWAKYIVVKLLKILVYLRKNIEQEHYVRLRRCRICICIYNKRIRKFLLL